VTAIDAVGDSSLRINGGFFIMRREIFDFMREGEELVEEPFQRLMAAGKLVAYEYDGFWAPMDTLKDLQMLQALEDSGRPPWAVWQRDDADAASRSDR
jgi:glucose-1-phosphate cytidylyltransferase